MRDRLIDSLIKIVTLCVIIFAISAAFIHEKTMIGWLVLGLGILCIVALLMFKIRIKSVWPDIVFGVIDNGILAVLAVLGGEVAGVVGAIIGGVVGNALTDGIAGVFEGYIAESLRKKKVRESRTMLGSATGKMAGCLLGAGVVLVIVSFLSFP